MYENEYALIRLEDLVSNPTPRVPVCLCLDTSGSMVGDPIRELNEGVRLFYDAIRNDETALYSAEVCIVTFGGGYQCIVDFATIDRQTDLPVLKANGGTPMGEAVNLALDLLEQRKEEYKNKGVDYYQPWLVFMTDGQPNGSEQELERAIMRTVELINKKRLSIFPIAIGEEADMEVLRRFSPTRQPLRLQGLKFKEFFSWLSKSVSRTSQSCPGEKIQLDIDGIRDWAEL